MFELVSVSFVDSTREELEEAFREIFQGRSNFQIEKFVVNAHVTSERQYAQCVLELQHKYFGIKKSDVARRRMLRDLEHVEDPLLREDILLDLQQHELAMLSALREFECLYDIFKSMPKFSRSQLESAEADYWVRRLVTQAQQDVEEHGSISAGNSEALRQIDIIRNYEERFAERVRDHSDFKLPTSSSDGPTT